ncbi:hypothetical protein AB3S75_036789 [Citrus x aurantiifolia]
MADFSLSLSEMLLPEFKSRWRLDPKGTNFSFWRHELDTVFFDNKVKYVLEQPIPDKESDPEAHQKFLDDDLTARHSSRQPLLVVPRPRDGQVIVRRSDFAFHETLNGQAHLFAQTLCGSQDGGRRRGHVGEYACCEDDRDGY